MATELHIQSGQWFCSVQPQSGLITALRCGDWQVLRSVADHTVALTAIDSAAFVMAPFAGRIAQGQFQWRGQQLQLARAAGEQHAMHGHAWQLPWSCLDHRAEALTLGFEWAGIGNQSHWPWAYRLQQHIQLGDDGFRIGLQLTNVGDDDMPSGLGWHPYFVRDDARIAVPASHMWSVDEQVLPRQRMGLAPDAELRVGEPVAGTGYDNPFELQTGEAVLRWPGAQRRLRLQWSASQARHFAFIFNHPQDNSFCLEPVTHVPNLLNLGAPPAQLGLEVLAPLESLSLDCAITLSE